MPSKVSVFQLSSVEQKLLNNTYKMEKFGSLKKTTLKEKIVAHSSKLAKGKKVEIKNKKSKK